MKLLSALIFLIFSTFSLYAQSGSIKGIIIDFQTKKALSGASIQLTKLNDSSKSFTKTNNKGVFALENIRKGRYIFKVTYTGYLKIERNLVISDVELDMGTISLNSTDLQLEGITVEADTPTSEQLGDTTQYNATAYKSNPDANAEDLIQKLPGVTLENGKAKAQGENIKEVLVDGKPFFANDPTAALKSLPAEVIDKIQLFDKKSDQATFTGFDDGQTSKTMNIITKADLKNTSFGKLYAGGGDNERYQLGGITNMFSGDTRISILAQSNNINKQNFAAEDLLGVLGASSGFGGGRMPGGMRPPGGGHGKGSGMRPPGGGTDISDFLVAQQNGIVTTHAFGTNYSDQWGKLVDVTGSYFFNYTDNNSEQNTARDYILGKSGKQIVDEFNNANSKNINHRFNMRLKFNIDSLNMLIIQPRISVQLNDGSSITNSNTFLNSLKSNQTQSDYNSDLKAYDISNSIFYARKFGSNGRSLSINLNTGYTKKDGENNLKYIFDSYMQSALSDTLDQFANLDKNGFNASTMLMYTEPLFDKFFLQVNYFGSINRNESDQMTYEGTRYTANMLDTSLTNTFKTLNYSNSLGTGIRYQDKGFFVIAGASGQWSRLENDQKYPFVTNINRDYFDVLPMVMVNFRPSKQDNFRLFYRANTNMPSIEQLQNVIDNSNPYSVSTGDPNIEDEKRHDLMLRYSTVTSDNTGNIFLMAGATFTKNYIGKNTFVAGSDTVYRNTALPAGAQFSSPVNLDGYKSFRSYASYGQYVGLISSNLNLGAGFDYNYSPSIINDQKNFSDSKSVSLNLALSSNISRNLDFTLSTNSALNYVSNSLRKDLNSDYFIQTTSFKLNWIFLDGFVFESNVEHQYYDGLSANYNPNIVIWNLGFGKKFLKGNKAELRLNVFDLLNQNSIVQRNIGEAYIEDIRYKVLERYFMLTFTYNLQILNLKS